jgi:hypothetical protein
MAAGFGIVAKPARGPRRPAAPIEILPQQAGEGDVAVVQHMLGTQDRGPADQGRLLMGGKAPVLDMQEILPPGIFVALEQRGIAEQAEAVDHLPFDLDGAGIECLRPRAGQRRQQQGNDDENPQHGPACHRQSGPSWGEALAASICGASRAPAGDPDGP